MALAGDNDGQQQKADKAEEDNNDRTRSQSNRFERLEKENEVAKAKPGNAPKELQTAVEKSLPRKFVVHPLVPANETRFHSAPRDDDSSSGGGGGSASAKLKFSGQTNDGKLIHSDNDTDIKLNPSVATDRTSCRQEIGKQIVVAKEQQNVTYIELKHDKNKHEGEGDKVQQQQQQDTIDESRTGSRQKQTFANKWSFDAILSGLKQHQQYSRQRAQNKEQRQVDSSCKTTIQQETRSDSEFRKGPEASNQIRQEDIDQQQAEEHKQISLVDKSNTQLDQQQSKFTSDKKSSRDDEQENTKLRDLPSFGESRIKLQRLPYYTYQGRARNVALVSANDRPDILSRHSSASEEESGGDSRASVSLSSATNDSTTSNNNQDTNRKNLNQNSASQYNRTYLSKKQLQLLARGYSNISNLFPDKPMLIGRSRAQTTSSSSAPYWSRGTSTTASAKALDFAQNQQQASSLSEPEVARHKPPFSTSGKPARYSASGYNNTTTRNKSRSLLNLNQLVVPKQVTNNRLYNYHHQYNNLASATMRRHNSLLGGQAVPLGGAGAGTGAGAGSAGGGGKISGGGGGGATVAGRPASVSGNYGHAGARTHRRSPSAGSLHYGAQAAEVDRGYHHHSAGYGGGIGAATADQEPDFPVHGLSAYDLDKSGADASGVLGNSADAESPYGYPLYGARRRGPAAYYDGRGGGGAADRLGGRQTAYASVYSLYSPTSPIEQHSTGRPAYYDRESRFSVYQSGAGGANLRDRADSGYKSSGIGHTPVGSRLAPPKEQLRRILGYPVPTKPVHLHPQWAYSRPFHHLLPSGAEWTAPSPTGGADDGLFIDYDDDINQLNASLLRFSPFNKLEDTQAIRAVDFHPSGQVYAIGSNSRALRICAYPAPSELNSFGATLLAPASDSPSASPATHHLQTPHAPRVLFKFLQVHRGSIYCVRFNKTGQLLATGSNDQTVHIVRYNSRTHSPEGDEYRLTMHDGTVRDLCFIDDATSGNSLLLSAGGGDNKIYVTDCDTITPFQSFAGHTGMVMGLHHLGGAQFVSGSQDRTIRFWDLRTRQCTSIVSAPPARPGSRWAGGPGAPVCAVQADHSGRLLVSGHTDSTCMLYDIRGARIIQAFKPHEDEIRTVSFSPKSYYLLTGAYDGRIVLSDLQGDLNQPLPSVCVAESDDKIIQSRWHPTDFTFVTTSANKTATLWVPPTDGM